MKKPRAYGLKGQPPRVNYGDLIELRIDFCCTRLQVAVEQKKVQICVDHHCRWVDLGDEWQVCPHCGARWWFEDHGIWIQWTLPTVKARVE